MASSSSSGSQRRRHLTKRQPLSRRNSSFFGSLKSLVTAPLAWFASTDDFEDSKDFYGKRRRLAGAPSEPAVEEDDRSMRNKRMRMDSPPRDESCPQPSASVHGYLDPPSYVFQQQQHRQSSPLIQSSSTRFISAMQPYDLNNNNINYLRASTLSRTMSIDPPPRPLSSASAASIPFHRDTSIDSSNLIRTVPRDLSMPPLSGRPSFLMRTSMTPQPLREVSEPPTLNTLNSNPTFLRAPSAKATGSLQNGLTRSSSTTLGSLVDSVRRHHSPARQHSSLMFGENNREHTSISPHPETAIEKALHELDIYKTPLVPTRLRSSNISAMTASSNMFKSRRASNLILMQSDGRSERLGRKVSGKKEAPLPNETKPYAGEGGMKRLLAKRKQEADEEKNLPVDDEQMDDDSQTRHQKVANRSDTTSELPPPSRANRLSINTSSSVQSSSLRVGRTKTRNHIARPTRPTKMKFSAAFDEEAADDVDDVDEEAIQRKKEIDVLEEAAKRAPIFKIPEGFSFAKQASDPAFTVSIGCCLKLLQTKPVEIDSSRGKEPPIKTLPFSLTKADNPPPSQENDLVPSIVQSAGTPTVGSSSQIFSALAPQPTQPAQLRVPSPLLQAQTVETIASVPATPPIAVPATNGMPNFFANSAVLSKSITPQPSTSGMPNFFASSSTLSKPLDLPPPAPLVFNFSSAVPSNPPVPVKDAENPLWEGESKKIAESSASKSSLFDSPGSLSEKGLLDTSGGVATAPITAASSPSLSSNEKLAKSTLAPTQPICGETPTVTPSFSSKSGEPPAAIGNETPKPSIFDASSASVTPTFGNSAPTPSAAISLFGSSTNEIVHTTLSGPSFAFGQTTRSTSTSVEAPKPLVGTVEAPKLVFGNNGSGGFSFGGPSQNQTEQKSSSTPFSFETMSSKEVEQKPANTVFSFGNTGAKEAEQKSASSVFTFGKTGEAEQKSAGTPFSFGNMNVPPGKPAFSFGNTSKETEAKPTNSPFSFGAAPSTPPPADGNQSSPYTFGASAPSAPAPAPASVGFSFSGSGSDASTKLFSFGQSTRPVTPPKNQDLEVSMDESPTRDTQQTAKPADRLIIGGNGFSFGTSAPTSSFGTQNNSSTSFSFGAPSSSTPVFGKPSEGNSFSFGQAVPATPASSGFNFGQSKTENEPTRTSTTGSFSFNISTSATGSAPGFPFGGAGNNSTGSAFGQSQSGSAPGSPSTFPQQPSPFSFGAPLPPVNTAFSFGSQPASPAGVNLSLPQPATPGGFGNTVTSGFGQAQQQQPSSPFGASNPPAPATGGAALFTIGAPPAPPSGTGTRTIRKLPNRRGGAKR
ncbi:hypothetical protein C0995_010843 [Termitomyces sp. Mi166|nr:hypothetical protein C0995_010843 [Termitomyces sp. Mi166\